MSGHSKWSTIKRQKGVNDAKRGQLFTKLGRAITLAAKKGGTDPTANFSLRKTIEDARAESLPKENIERAIQRAKGGGEGSDLVELSLEAYGPVGVAFLINCLTDNRNRTISQVREVLTRFSASVGGAGSTTYIFTPDPENPNFMIKVEDEDTAGKLVSLAAELENLDDVQKIYSNFEIPESILARLDRS